MDAVVVKVWLNELTLLQEQPKTAMEEAGVALLDSCTCYDHCPGSLKDNARSGNYHPLATCWRHVGDIWRVVFNATELSVCGKRSLWSRNIPKLHWRRLRLFSGGLSPGFACSSCDITASTFSGDNVWVLLFFGGKCDALSCAHSAGTAHSCHGGGWSCCLGAFFLLWLLSLILERSCGLWKSTLIRFCWLVFELIACGKRSFWNRNSPKLHWRRLRLFSGGLSPEFACSSCDISASTFSGDKVVFIVSRCTQSAWEPA